MERPRANVSFGAACSFVAVFKEDLKFFDTLPLEMHANIMICSVSETTSDQDDLSAFSQLPNHRHPFAT
jgi:hypothetical protein